MIKKVVKYFMNLRLNKKKAAIGKVIVQQERKKDITLIKVDSINRRAVYRKTQKLINEGWEKEGNIEQERESYPVYFQTLKKRDDLRR